MRRSVPYALFAAGCTLAILASQYVSRTAAATAETRERVEFMTDAQQTRRRIQAGLDSYIEVVRTGAVLLSADNEIAGAEFRRFVAGLKLRDRYPGLEGIGFAQCVEQRALRRFLRVIDLDGNRINLWPAGARPMYCPTVFLEPRSARTKAASGFDLLSSPVLADALMHARDTGEPAASVQVTAPPFADADGTGRVVVMIPVYRPARSLATVEARRSALVGVVFGPLDTKRIVEDIVGTAPMSITFEVYDGEPAASDNVLARSDLQASLGPYVSADRVQVAGRDWLVVVKSTETAPPPPSPVAQQTLVGGIALAFMLLLVTRAQVRAWETAARHEAELQESAQALRASEAEARQANQAKDEFLATLSHELRTPLNVVLGWVSMLRHGAVTSERLPHALEVIERNARQQAELIDDLLDVSRIVLGKLKLELTALPLAPVVASVIESLRPSAEEKRVALHYEVHDEAMTLGDADRLRQTVWNLVANAIKFTPTGGSVNVVLMRAGDKVRLTVRDTGVGIEPDFLPHVFERFRQADSSTTRMHGGVGLGLAIASHLVELHGGTIEAYSDGPGKGATFVLELPSAAADFDAPHASLPVPTVPASLPALDGVRVLVVDDDAGTRDLLATALHMTGAQVTATGSARDALQRLRESGADVIVSDIAMPGEDGFWLMEHVRTLDGEAGRTPAIAVTALARSEDRARIIDAGYQMYLPKPVELSELQTGVATLAAERAHSPHMIHATGCER